MHFEKVNGVKVPYKIVDRRPGDIAACYADPSKAEKEFKMDMKKHIDAISSKYIIPGETSNQAILFLPAEAIFAEINAYHEDIINYAYNKNNIFGTKNKKVFSFCCQAESASVIKPPTWSSPPRARIRWQSP